MGRGYSGPYNLGVRVVYEAIGTLLAVGVGNGAVANHVLKSCRGHDMGYGWLSLAYGLAFSFAFVAFSEVSAYLNPAVTMGFWVAGKIGVADFFALSAAQLAGAFVSGVAVWGVYYLHFNQAGYSNRRPGEHQIEDLVAMVPKLDKASEAALREHTTRLQAVGNSTIQPLGSKLSHINSGGCNMKGDVDGWAANADLTWGRSMLARAVPSTITRRGVPSIMGTAGRSMINYNSHSVIGRTPFSVINKKQVFAGTGAAVAPQLLQRHVHVVAGAATPPDLEAGVPAVQPAITVVNEGLPADMTLNPAADPTMPQAAMPIVNIDKQMLPQLIDQFGWEFISDENPILIVFATRPAVYSWMHSFLAEMTATFVFTFYILMTSERGRYIVGDSNTLYNQFIQPFASGIIITLMVLALGGPTGFAGNPARDLGPRLAHWILPIKDKGASEFQYGWVPVIAPLAGGAAAGGIFLALRLLQHGELM